MTEAEIKRLIADWLSLQPGCMIWYNQNNGVIGRRNSSKYARNGVPDIMGIWHGIPLGIEIKKPNGIVSEEQKAFLAEFNEHGGIGLVARSLEELKGQLSSISRQRNLYLGSF